MNSKFADKAAFISSSRKCAVAFFLALVSESCSAKSYLPRAVEKFFANISLVAFN